MLSSRTGLKMQQARGTTLIRSLQLRPQRDAITPPTTHVCPTSHPTGPDTSRTIRAREPAMRQRCCKHSISVQDDRLVRPRRSIWRTAYDSALSTPNSLCALIRFDLRVNGLRSPRRKPAGPSEANANHFARFRQNVNCGFRNERMNGCGIIALTTLRASSAIRQPEGESWQTYWSYTAAHVRAGTPPCWLTRSSRAHARRATR